MPRALPRRTLGLGVFAGALAAGLAARQAAAQLGSAPVRGGTLVATLGGNEPQAVYVPAGGGPSPTLSSSKVLERLAKRNLDGRFGGVLAEWWRPAPDFKSYAVKLRQGVVFHDGREMTVDDVAYSVGEIWRTYSAADMMTDFAGIDAAGRDTVVFRFTRPTPEFFFSSLLGGGANYVVPRHLYAGRDPATNPANEAPIGTGPWKFKEWTRGSHIEYVRNEAYWRRGYPIMDRLMLRYVRDPAGRAAAMEAGEIQIGVLDPVAAPDVKRLTSTGKFVATTAGYEDSVRATTLECNLRRPLLAKREVRQAIFHAIDRSHIARAIYHGHARAGVGPIFAANKEFVSAEIHRTDFDPKKAAALLDAAGHPKPRDGKRFSIDLVAAGWFAENARVGAYVKQALEDVGIGVALAVPDRAASLKRIYTDYDFDLAISNQANPSEPVPATTQYYTTDGMRKGVPFHNASGYSNPELDELVEQIRVETDPLKRRDLVGRFQKIVTEDAPLLPLVELDSVTLASVRVQNHSTDPNFLGASWYDIWLS